MKKIFFVIPTLQGGGAEKVISKLVLNLDKKKYKISVVVFDLSKQIYLKQKNINIFHLGNKKITLGIYNFLKLIKLKARFNYKYGQSFKFIYLNFKIFFPRIRKL